MGESGVFVWVKGVFCMGEHDDAHRVVHHQRVVVAGQHARQHLREGVFVWVKGVFCVGERGVVWVRTDMLYG